MFDSWQQIRALEPLSPGPSQSRKPKSERGKSRRKKPTVLVVDDEQLIADTTTEILKRSGFHAVSAYGRRSALEPAPQLPTG